MYLYELMKKAGIDNVFYVDTDSLFVNRRGYDNLSGDIVKGVLGKLNIEDTATTLLLYGAKDYHFGDTIKHKGVPHKSTLISDNTFQYQQFIGAKTWGNNGFTTGVEIYTKVKRRMSQYDKGVVDLLGFVTPHRLINR